MNYKKLIKSRNVRLKILSFLKIIPDKTMIKIQYFIKTGKKLNLTSPQRYTEKLQWYKLYYRDPLMTICADKYEVRNYVKQKGFQHILTQSYGAYDSMEKIDFKNLPQSFAIKHTNSSGRNLFIKDKSKLNVENLKKEISEWLTTKISRAGREWCHYNVPNRIIIEELIERDENNDIPDYKFFCFNGKVKYLYTMINYVDDHSKGECSFFTPEFKKLPYRRSEYKAIDKNLKKPKNFDEMVRIAEALSQDFPHVRVDLYNIEGRIIFGELTFYNASGYTVFSPDKFDFILGEKFKLPQKFKA